MAKNRSKPNKRVKLSRGFYRDQFTCKCGCGFNTVDYNLIVVLQELVDKIGRPVEIYEGDMCPKRVKDTNTKGTAQSVGKGAVIFVPPAPANNLKDPMNNKDIGSTLDKMFGDIITYYPIEKSDTMLFVSVETV
jgi:hypothetical protein